MSKKMKQPGARRLSDTAYQRLREEILDGRLRVGARLVELSLCGSLGMGRTPVREALLRLEGDGLVEGIPNAGFVVRHLSLEDVEEAYEIRCGLEGAAARLACRRGFSEFKLMELEGLCEALLDAGKRGDTRRVDEADLEFHQKLIALAGSRRLETAVRSAHLQMFTWYRKEGRVRKLAEARRVAGEHRAILDALRRRDGDGAARLLERHVNEGFLQRLKHAMNAVNGAGRVPRFGTVGTLARA